MSVSLPLPSRASLPGYNQNCSYRRRCWTYSMSGPFFFFFFFEQRPPSTHSSPLAPCIRDPGEKKKRETQILDRQKVKGFPIKMVARGNDKVKRKWHIISRGPRKKLYLNEMFDGWRTCVEGNPINERYGQRFSYTSVIPLKLGHNRAYKNRSITLNTISTKLKLKLHW